MGICSPSRISAITSVPEEKIPWVEEIHSAAALPMVRSCAQPSSVLLRNSNIPGGKRSQQPFAPHHKRTHASAGKQTILTVKGQQMYEFTLCFHLWDGLYKLSSHPDPDPLQCRGRMVWARDVSHQLMPSSIFFLKTQGCSVLHGQNTPQTFPNALPPSPVSSNTSSHRAGRAEGNPGIT